MYFKTILPMVLKEKKMFRMTLRFKWYKFSLTLSQWSDYFSFFVLSRNAAQNKLIIKSYLSKNNKTNTKTMILFRLFYILPLGSRKNETKVKGLVSETYCNHSVVKLMRDPTMFSLGVWIPRFLNRSQLHMMLFIQSHSLLSSIAVLMK